MLQRLHGIHRTSGHERGLLDGQIGDQAQVQHFTLFIGQRGEKAEGFCAESFEGVGLDIAAETFVAGRETPCGHPAIVSSALVDHLVPGNREQQCHERTLVSMEVPDALKRPEKGLVAHSLGVVAPLSCGEGGDLPGETVPQPFETRRLTLARGRQCSPERGIVRSMLHIGVIDLVTARLDSPNGSNPPRRSATTRSSNSQLLLGFGGVNPLVPRISRRVKGAVRELAGASATADANIASPYTEWHGPRPTQTHGLVVTPIADLLLVQGIAPADIAVTIELDAPVDPLQVAHRFPHPSTPSADAVCFETTIDATVPSAASRCRLVAGNHVGDWHGLPARPTPGSMHGDEHLDRCPACRSSDFETVGRRQHLDMTVCVRCGLVMTNPRPPEGDTLLRYSERYFTDEYLPAQQMSAPLLAHIDSILDVAEPARRINPALFELGVGGGNLAARAAERGWEVSGTDVNVASVEHATARGLDVWADNADHSDSLRGPYGAIISEMSLEHVRHPERFCALAADALDPGGRLVIYTVSAEGNSFEHAGMASPLVGPGEHLFLFSAGSLVSLCQRAGLRVESVWRNPSADEIGIVAVKRRDVGNPGVQPRSQPVS